MATFSKLELQLVEGLEAGKSSKKLLAESKLSEETFSDRLERLQGKLSGAKLSEIPERFRLLTGWSGAPTDYPQ